MISFALHNWAWILAGVFLYAAVAVVVATRLDHSAKHLTREYVPGGWRDAMCDHRTQATRLRDCDYRGAGWGIFWLPAALALLVAAPFRGIAWLATRDFEKRDQQLREAERIARLERETFGEAQ